MRPSERPPELSPLRQSGMGKGVYAKTRRKMGLKSYDRLHSPAARLVQQDRNDDRQDIGFEEGFSKRSRVRHADVDLLHESGRTRIER